MEPRWQKYKDQNYQQYLVIQDGITGPDSAFLCKQLRTKYGLTFPVLYDPAKTLSGVYKTGVNEGNLIVGTGSVLVVNQKGASPANVDKLIDAELNK